jgi:hypothetical protein
MDKKIIVFSFALWFISTSVSARVMQMPDTSRFQQKLEFKVEGITTPKVVQYQTVQSLGDFVALQSNESFFFTPVQLRKVTTTEPWNLPVESSSPLLESNLRALQDQNLNNAVTFDSANSGALQITFNNPENRRLTQLNIDLATNTIPPGRITLRAQLAGSDEWKTIIDRGSFSSSIRFPEIQPRQIQIQFDTRNLLRIAELEWTTTSRSALTTQSISFYAEEGQSFTLYSQPNFGQARINTNGQTPTSVTVTTPTFDLPITQRNPNYDLDFDDDGVLDTQDLCPRVIDATNADLDKNGQGDACEDPDQDGLNSALDNCPFAPNRNQTDSDNDGIGDACDNQENRLSEQSGWWINLSFGIMIIALLGLVARSAWPRPKP